MNVLSKILIPRIIASIRYILTELEESEREETFRLKRVKQNKLRNLEKLQEVGAGEMMEFIDRQSEMNVIESVRKTIEGPPVKVLSTTESGDPLVVIKPPETCETGDTSKSTQQFQTIKHENELEDVDKKQDVQEVVEEAVQFAKAESSPETHKLFKTSKALLTVPKTEELGETFATKSNLHLDETVAFQEGIVQNELTTDNLLKDVNITQNKTTKSFEENISQAEDLLKFSLGKTEELQLKRHEELVQGKGENVSLETSSQVEISKSSEEKELIVISPEEIEEFQETAQSSSFGGNELNVKIKSSISDENIQHGSKICSTIWQPESTKLFEGAISLDNISESDLNQQKLTLKEFELLEDNAKEISTKSPPEMSKNDIIKSKSSVRINLPEDDNIEVSTSRSDRISIDLPPDKNMGSKTIKELVTREKVTEGSVEKLGEGDSEMYTGQSQNIPEKTRVERSGSVEGIVDVEPYFETASISKPSISMVEGSAAIISITETDRRKDDYYEADIELDETDIEIGTSRVAQSSTAVKREVEEAEPEANTNEQRHDSDVDGRDKRSKSPDDKKRQS